MVSHGPVAIVTGAAQGIGYAISDSLLQEGYRVCLSDLNAEKGNESLAELQTKYSSDRMTFVECDVSSQGSFEDLFTKTQEQFGTVDLLVNNAGIVDEDNPERTVAVNLMGTIFGCHLALKYMGTSNGGKGGVVVNVASIVGLVPLVNIPVYTATKHGVVGLTRSYGGDVHLNQNGVIFMAICPYYARTPMLRNAIPLMPFSMDKVSIAIDPEFVAEGVLKLLKEKKNGSTLVSLPEGHKYIEIQDELKDVEV